MAETTETPGVSKFESTLLLVFIPSVDRQTTPIDQERWVSAALEAMGTWFGGATAFPQGRGVWRDDAQGRKLIYHNPVIIHCYTNIEAIKRRQPDLHALLVQMGTQANQGAVAVVIDRQYLEIVFPLKETLS